MARILIVEDNDMNLRLATDLLQMRGHDIVAASSAAECRARLQAPGPLPDVVLMDVRLPDGDGETLLQEIRANPRLRALCVLAVTAQAMHGDRERFMEAGFDGYLSKPLDTRRFGAEVESHVRP
jgi:two-component system cell cycle response regulator